MLNSEIETNSQTFPKNFQRDYDAHVYYTSESRDEALAFREKVLIDYKDQPVWVSRMVDRNVGPHPEPMFEINFPKELFPTMLYWLMHERKNLNILVHEVTGDDPKDHFEGALWLGKSLILDKSKLDDSPKD
jgi:aromatic ring-cleaving dioxygenase